MLVGAYDPSTWTGLVFSDRPGHGFALDFAIERDGERAEGYDLMHIVHEVGPYAPDGSYARVSFDTYLPLGKGHDTPTVAKTGRVAGLTLEWSRRTDQLVVGRLSISYHGVLEVRGYFPWDWRGTWIRGRVTAGRASEPTVQIHSFSGAADDGRSVLAVHIQSSNRLPGSEVDPCEELWSRCT
jgi:hypothetical protein